MNTEDGNLYCRKKQCSTNKTAENCTSRK